MDPDDAGGENGRSFAPIYNNRELTETESDSIVKQNPILFYRCEKKYKDKKTY